jgi:hypothetical protein
MIVADGALRGRALENHILARLVDTSAGNVRLTGCPRHERSAAWAPAVGRCRRYIEMVCLVQALLRSYPRSSVRTH